MSYNTVQPDTPYVANEIFLAVILEAWRFSQVYQRLISSLDSRERNRWQSQYRYFVSELESHLGRVGYKLEILDGQPYDPGMAATAVNRDEFAPTDTLVVEHMLEPIILSETHGVIRAGKMVLRTLG
jgi:hypothetical protein